MSNTTRPRTVRIVGKAPDGRDSWYRIRNQSSDQAEVLLYDEVGYWGSSASDFMDELRGITAPNILLRINSPGGDVFDGIAIMNLLRNHPANVTVHVDGIAASIASVIAMAGDRVIMQPHSQMMIHEAAGFEFGDAADLRAMADLLDKNSDNIASVYAQHAGGEVAEWRARMTATTWFTAAEAVEVGLADEVAQPVRRDDDQDVAARMAARWDLSVYAHADPETPAAPAPVEPVSAPAAHRLVSEHGPELVAGPADGTPATPVAAVEPVATPPVAVAPATPAPTAATSAPAPAEPEPVGQQPETDEWAGAIAHLTEETAPSDGDDEFARLTEALL